MKGRNGKKIYNRDAHVPRRGQTGIMQSRRMNGLFTNRKIAFGFYAFLFTLGLIMYFGWGIYFGTWNVFDPRNIGVYAIVVILVAFGIVGMLLYYKE